MNLDQKKLDSLSINFFGCKMGLLKKIFHIKLSGKVNVVEHERHLAQMPSTG